MPEESLLGNVCFGSQKCVSLSPSPRADPGAALLATHLSGVTGVTASLACWSTVPEEL